MRIKAVLVLMAFLAVGVFGMSHAIDMEREADGTMGGCFFIDMDEICRMSFSEHLTQWQNMFTGVPVKSNILSLLALALLVFYSSFLKRFSLQIQKLYLIHHRDLFLFNPLRETFSQGILNSKTF